MEYRLEELCNITSSKRIYRDEYVCAGVPFYRGKEIIEKSNNQKVTNELFITEEKYDEIKNKFGVPKIGDILITGVGTIGISYLVNDEKFYFKDGNLIWLKDFNDKINNKFLSIYFKTQKFKIEIKQIAIGSTQKAITIAELKKLKIDVPHIKIQNKIVEVYNSIQNKIELNNQVNDNLLELINNLYKESFSNIEEYKQADEIANITIGKTPPRSNRECFTYNEDDIKWLSISDLGKCGMYAWNTSEKLTEDAVNKYNVKVIPENTIVLSFKLTIGRIAITANKMATNEAIAHFNLIDRDMIYYLYSYLKNFDYSKLGNTSSIATAVNSKIIKAMPIGVPNKTMILEFNNKVKPLFEKIKLNEAQNETLTQLRDTLLPKLMNGEIDLDKIEI